MSNREYHCEIIETITGRTIGIFVGSLNAISNRLLDNGFAPVDPLGNMTGEWAKCSKFEPELYARFIEIKKNGSFVISV
jgi:hypothetical protein